MLRSAVLLRAFVTVSIVACKYDFVNLIWGPANQPSFQLRRRGKTDGCFCRFCPAVARPFKNETEIPRNIFNVSYIHCQKPGFL